MLWSVKYSSVVLRYNFEVLVLEYLHFRSHLFHYNSEKYGTFYSTTFICRKMYLTVERSSQEVRFEFRVLRVTFLTNLKISMTSAELVRFAALGTICKYKNVKK